jgi:hypothetical protein
MLHIPWSPDRGHGFDLVKLNVITVDKVIRGPE